MGKYQHISLFIIFVSACIFRAFPASDPDSLLDKAEQGLYSNPAQSAFFAQQVFKQSEDVCSGRKVFGQL